MYRGKIKFFDKQIGNGSIESNDPVFNGADVFFARTSIQVYSGSIYKGMAVEFDFQQRNGKFEATKVVVASR